MNEGLVVLVRSLIAFFTLLLFARLLGKQHISQLTFFDYALAITVGSIAATLSVDLGSNAWTHWVGLVTWTAAVLAMQFVSIKWLNMSKYIIGEPVLVIINGKIMDKAMKSIRYTISDLLEQLREKGVFDLNQVSFAVLETDGKISILLKPEYLPVTAGDLNIPVQDKGISTELIFDGVIIEENLKKANIDRSWLMDELKKSGINKASEVFLATIDKSGQLYIDKYKDN